MQREQVRGLAGERRSVIDELDGELAIDEVQLHVTLGTVLGGLALMAARSISTLSCLFSRESRASLARPRLRARSRSNGDVPPGRRDTPGVRAATKARAEQERYDGWTPARSVRRRGHLPIIDLAGHSASARAPVERPLHSPLDARPRDAAGFPLQDRGGGHASRRDASLTRAIGFAW